MPKVNARASCAEVLEFKYRAGEILHSDANGSSTASTSTKIVLCCLGAMS